MHARFDLGDSTTALARLRGRTASMVFQEPATALDPLTRVASDHLPLVMDFEVRS